MAKSKYVRRRRDWTAEELHAHVTYNPETGEFWTTPRRIGAIQNFGKTRVPAETITLKSKDGKWRKYYSHILAWLYMTGEWPRDEIDHINNNSTDNRWCNLREATHTENNRNKDFSRINGHKLVGAFYHKQSGLWRAIVRRKSLGYFKTPEEAHEVYKKEALKNYGKFAHTKLHQG